MEVFCLNHQDRSSSPLGPHGGSGDHLYQHPAHRFLPPTPSSQGPLPKTRTLEVRGGAEACLVCGPHALPAGPEAQPRVGTASPAPSFSTSVRRQPPDTGTPLGAKC